MLLAALFAAALAAEPAPQVAEGPTAEVIPLRFAWPLDRPIDVAFAREDARTLPDGTRRSQATSARWTVTPRADGDAVRLDVSGYAVTLPPDEPANPLASPMAAMIAAAPSLRVDATGTLLQVLDPDAALADARRVVARLAPAVAAEVAPAVSADQLGALAKDWWNAMIYVWSDTDVELGTSYPQTTRTMVPAIGVPVTLHVTTALEARVPCGADDVEARCVRLVTRSTLDDAEVAAAIGRLAAAVTNATAPRLTGLRMTTVCTVIADPATLVPVRLDVTRENALAVVEGGRAGEVSGSDTRSYVFTPRAPAPAGRPSKAARRR